MSQTPRKLKGLICGYGIIDSLQGITDGYTVLYEVTFNCD